MTHYINITLKVFILIIINTVLFAKETIYFGFNVKLIKSIRVEVRHDTTN